MLSAAPPRECDRLVDEFASRVPGVAHAVAVSPAGLRLAASHRLPLDKADQVAAAASGLMSLIGGAAQWWRSGPVSQAVIGMELGIMIVMPIGEGACLVALAAPTCDMGHVAFRMTQVAQWIGEALTLEGAITAGDDQG